MKNYQVMIKNIFKKIKQCKTQRRTSAKHFHTEVVLACRQSCFFCTYMSPFTIMHCLFIQLATTPLLVLFLGSDDLSMVSASTVMK